MSYESKDNTRIQSVERWATFVLVTATLVLLSSCIPDPAAAEEIGTIESPSGETLSRLHRTWNGEVELRDRRGRTEAVVEPRTGKLLDRSGRSIGTVKLPEREPGRPHRREPKNRWTGTWEERWR